MNDTTLSLNNLSSDNDQKQKLNTMSNPSLQCEISPMVIMSILNHYQRRPSNRTKQQQQPNQQQAKYPPYVIGLLFGRKNVDTNSIYITDSFGLEIQINPQNNVWKY